MKKIKYIEIFDSNGFSEGMRRVYSKEEMEKMADENQDICFWSIPGTTEGWLYSRSAGH